MLKTVKVGDKVKFEADRVNGQFTVKKGQVAISAVGLSFSYFGAAGAVAFGTIASHSMG